MGLRASRTRFPQRPALPELLSHVAVWSLTESSLAGLAAGHIGQAILPSPFSQPLASVPPLWVTGQTLGPELSLGAGPSWQQKAEERQRRGCCFTSFTMAFLKSHFLSQFREAGVSVFKCLQLLFRSCESLVFSKYRTAIFSSGGGAVSS